MSDDTSLGADIATAMGASTSTPDASADAASTVETTAPEGAATTAPAVDTTETPTAQTDTVPPHTAGPIPFDVHKTALDNARQKAVAEYQQKYGWAEQVNQADVQEAVRIAQLAQRDPIAYVQEFIKDLGQHPTYGAQLKSLAARALAQRSQPQATEPDLNPIPVELSDGRTVPLYSADQISALKAQWLAEVKQEFQPVFQTHETLKAQQATAQREHEISTYVTSTYQDVQTWPGMSDVTAQKAVAEELARANVDPNDPREVSLALNAAYRKVVLPNLQRTATDAAVSNQQLKASVNTVSPGRQAAGTPKTYAEMGWAEAFQHELAARRR